MAAKVLEQNYVKLVKVLPMDNPEFRAELVSRGLLRGENKAKIQSTSMSRAEKAEYFLTNVIEPEIIAGFSTKMFEDLLGAMMCMNGQEALAENIKGMLYM